MPSIDELSPGQRCSFEVYPSNQFGTYQNVRIEGFLTPDTAVLLGVDIVGRHQAVYPTLPPNSVQDNAYSYSWLRIKRENGVYDVLGAPWIRPETIVLSSSTKLTLTFNDKTATDMERILLAIQGNGYTPDDVRMDN